MSATSTDPFSVVYDALWAMLEGHVGFSRLVKVGNRIKFSGRNADPMKQSIMPADVPEVRVVTSGGTPHLQRTSNSSSCVKRFGVMLSTADLRMDASLFPVEWEILKAMSNWQATLLALKWNNRPFVKLARLVSTTEGLLDKELNRGIQGWTAVMVIEVEMWFSTEDLQTVGA